MELTKRGFKKPEPVEPFDILDFNGNTDNLEVVLDRLAEKTTEDITYYVDKVAGDDSNDGLTSGTAFKTITKAISMIPQVVNHKITIGVAPGDYTSEGEINFSGLIGNGWIAINGDTVVSTSRSIESIMVHYCSCPIVFTGFNVTGTTKHSVDTDNSKRVVLYYMNLISNAPTYNAVKAYWSNISVLYSVISNKNNAIIAIECGNIYSYNNTGSNNIYGLSAQRSSKIGKHLTQPTGTTQESAGGGGEIVGSIRYEQIQVTRDLSLTGVQTVSGLSGIPKRIDVRTSIYDAYNFSIGSYIDGKQGNLYSRTADSVSSDSIEAIRMYFNGSTEARGIIENIQNGSFDINWNLIGSPTGTANICFDISY